MCQTECLILDVDSSRDVTLYRLPIARNLHDVISVSVTLSKIPMAYIGKFWTGSQRHTTGGVARW